MKRLSQYTIIALFPLVSGCCFELLWGLLEIGECGGGGSISVTDNIRQKSCTGATGSIVPDNKRFKCCTVIDGTSLKPECYFEEKLVNSQACHDWFDDLDIDHKTYISSPEIPDGCPSLTATTFGDSQQEVLAETVAVAERALSDMQLGESDSGGVKQDQAKTSEAAVAGLGNGEVPVEPDLPSPVSNNIPFADLSGGFAPGNSLSSSSSGLSNLGGFGNSESRGDSRHVQPETEEANEADLEPSKATPIGSAANIAAKKPKKKDDLLNRFIGAKGRSVDSPGVGKDGTLTFGNEMRGNRIPAHDPKDYFGRIPLVASLFKVVERRYRNEALKWRSSY